MLAIGGITNPPFVGGVGFCATELCGGITNPPAPGVGLVGDVVAVPGGMAKPANEGGVVDPAGATLEVGDVLDPMLAETGPGA